MPHSASHTARRSLTLTARQGTDTTSRTSEPTAGHAADDKATTGNDTAKAESASLPEASAGEP
jgi:hypothetical protein